jgi:glycosyltransferase involved in cell wall biosynthesis
MNLLSKALPNRGFVVQEKKTYPLWNELERQVMLCQDHFWVMGSLIKAAIEAAYRIEPGKITAVGAGPGHDLDIVRDGGSKHPSNKRILFVGREAERKGVRVLMQAFELVRKDFPDALLDVVAGVPVSGTGVTCHRGLNESSLKRLFYSANIFAMPSYREPLGLVFIEAMLSKAACLGTTTGSVPDVIRDGETGYLVGPGDPVTLADRLARLLRDPLRTRDMGERGYRAAKEYWQWDLVVERMSNALRERGALPDASAAAHSFR